MTPVAGDRVFRPRLSQGLEVNDMDEWIGIYKGLRLPFLGIIFMYIVWYVFRPKKKKEMEEARYTMLDDEMDPDLSTKARQKDGSK